MHPQCGFVCLFFTLFVCGAASAGSPGEKAGIWGNWLVGEQGKSCTDACQDHAATCSEEHWPTSIEEFKAILGQANYGCQDIQDGIVRYDPSAAGAHCGWQSETWTGPRCGYKPPVTTKRFCYCQGVIIQEIAVKPIPFEVTMQPPSTTPRFDCSIGVIEWQSKWSFDKQIWCCEHEHRGCTSTTTTTTSTSSTTHFSALDCAIDAQWTVEKKAWCCEHAEAGCPEAADPLQQALEQLETAAKPTTTTTTTTIPLYNCFTDSSDRGSWSYGKKDWCCQYKNIGCRYDCDIGFADWKMAWSGGKSEWCCQHRGRGCVVPIMKQ